MKCQLDQLETQIFVVFSQFVGGQFEMTIYCTAFDHPETQALNDAKRELRYLLVYLHGDDHQDTDEFCRYSTYDLICLHHLIEAVRSCYIEPCCCSMSCFCFDIQLLVFVHFCNLL